MDVLLCLNEKSHLSTQQNIWLVQFPTLNPFPLSTPPTPQKAQTTLTLYKTGHLQGACPEREASMTFHIIRFHNCPLWTCGLTQSRSISPCAHQGSALPLASLVHCPGRPSLYLVHKTCSEDRISSFTPQGYNTLDLSVSFVVLKNGNKPLKTPLTGGNFLWLLKYSWFLKTIFCYLWIFWFCNLNWKPRVIVWINHKETLLIIIKFIYPILYFFPGIAPNVGLGEKEAYFSFGRKNTWKNWRMKLQCKPSTLTSFNREFTRELESKNRNKIFLKKTAKKPLKTFFKIYF